ncbi:hypothetical protein [Actinopolymorpha singaporensis]|uniref:Uncharacterized protein n=1 Tax=Actinopolymorpha singaporensis TaxID=117157 RepID=A0A1H1NYF6_9ACTN|nr:hypothetical protein [Actinopolymorpha singaporensis]SDS03987.1 hypothetical protein SAMN04489717_1419 [Actinopolymorpha singaporensis]
MLKALVLIALLVLAVGGPATCLLAASVLTTRVVRLVRRRVEHSRTGYRVGDRPALATVSSLGWLAALVSVGTVEAYAYGVLRYSPGLFPDKTCYFTMGARAFPDSSGLLPLSTVCRGQEIVPVWFNPLMAALAVASAALLVAAPLAYARRRRVTGTTDPTDAGGTPGGAGAAISSSSERAE